MVQLVVLPALLGHVPVPLPPAQESEFIGRVVVEWLTDEDADRTMRLVEPFAFRDSRGKVWEVPAGAEIDGASIPQQLYSIVGPPFVGDYRRASVVHDHFCRERTEDWRAVHRMFYEAILAGGTPNLLAKTMYAAVLGWGPRWKAPAGRPGFLGNRDSFAGGSRVPAGGTSIPRPTPEESDLQNLGTWIAETNPSLDEIDRHVTDLLGEPSDEP